MPKCKDIVHDARNGLMVAQASLQTLQKIYLKNPAKSEIDYYLRSIQKGIDKIHSAIRNCNS